MRRPAAVGGQQHNDCVLFDDLARASEAIAATSSRTAKVGLLADALRRAGAADVPAAVAFLSGELRQRRSGLGWASLRLLPPPADEASLEVAEVDATFERTAGLLGPGSQTARREALGALLARATAAEQRMLGGLVSGELRQGASEALVVEAVARAAGVALADLRLAVMLRGALAPVAEAVLVEGAGGLARFRLEVGRPVQPMLASTSSGIDDAMARASENGPAGVEWKLDGVRVQVHRDGSDVSVFTRTLDDITARVPELAHAVLDLPVRALVLDGEALALRPDGRPRPFQVTAARAGTHDPDKRPDTPLTPYFFDLLHRDGDNLLALPGSERWPLLADTVPQALRAPRTETTDVEVARRFTEDALARGHEGVVVKAPDAVYAAGRRGVGWLKVKPVHTLDLVVLAAEWGHGRRRGWLSNLHLGARDPASGGHVMLGKTFKGLTDAMLTWQTERLLELATDRGDWVVSVRPQLVVEVAFDGVQTSPRYPGGVALRFARVLRHRPDKPAQEADTIDAVLALHTSD
jgi:ATP-dependent DNA ligase I